MEQEGGNDYHYSLPEASEYVRQQLAAMGVENVTEKELEAYTRGVLCWYNIYIYSNAGQFDANFSNFNYYYTFHDGN